MKPQGDCRTRPPHWGPEAGRLPSWRLRLGPGELRWQERYAAPGHCDGPTAVGEPQADILQALVALGYSDKDAAASVKSLPAGVGVAEGIKQALKTLVK